MKNTIIDLIWGIARGALFAFLLFYAYHSLRSCIDSAANPPAVQTR